MLTTEAEIESLFKDPVLIGMDRLDVAVVKACLATLLNIDSETKTVDWRVLDYILERFSMHRTSNPSIRNWAGEHLYVTQCDTELANHDKLKNTRAGFNPTIESYRRYDDPRPCADIFISDYAKVKAALYKLIHKAYNTQGSLKFSELIKFADPEMRRNFGLDHLTAEQVDSIKFRIMPNTLGIKGITLEGGLIDLDNPPMFSDGTPIKLRYRLHEFLFSIELRAITNPDALSTGAANLSGTLLGYTHRVVQPKLDPSVSYIGFELEMTRPRYAGEDNAAKVAEIANALGFKGEYITKRDGSIGDSGVEFVTQALTIDKYRGRYSKYLTLFNQLRKAGFISHDAKNCGLHFHISKAPIVQLVRGLYENDPTSKDRIKAMGGDDYYRVLTDLIIAESFKKLKQDLVRISRRQLKTGGQYSTWHTNIAKYRESRYSAVNCCPEHTYEIRIFRGTLNFNSFMIATEFAIIFNQVLMQALHNLSGRAHILDGDIITNARHVVSMFFSYSGDTFRYRVMTNLMNSLEKYSPASAVRLAMLLNPYAKCPVREDNYRVSVVQAA